MTYSHLRADCLYTGISSGHNARYRVWEAFTFTFYRNYCQCAASILPFVMNYFDQLLLSCLQYGGDNIVCVWQILDNGAVARDGRLKTGQRILEVISSVLLGRFFFTLIHRLHLPFLAFHIGNNNYYYCFFF